MAQLRHPNPESRAGDAQPPAAGPADLPAPAAARGRGLRSAAARRRIEELEEERRLRDWLEDPLAD